MDNDQFEIKSSVKVCNGILIRFSHLSQETKTNMICAVYLPNMIDRNDSNANIPSLLYLSGLTCTDENVCQKGYPYKALAEHNVRHNRQNVNYHHIMSCYIPLNRLHLLLLTLLHVVQI
jgi:S-formylglutathione hydrolase FrmB